MGEVEIEDLFSCDAKAVNDLADLGGIPDQHRIRQQAQTARFIHDLFQIPRPELAPVGEEQATCNQVMTRLAAIQLQLNTTAQFFVVDVAKNIRSS